MEYDYIIIGGGSAGCVLAHRLTEDPDVRVLLLEAGGTDHSLWISMPAGITKLFTSRKFNWPFFTEPGEHINQRSLYYPQGKVLGGGSSVNGMIFLRGHRHDYDHWGSLGNLGWHYDDVLPYFKKSEKTTIGDDAYHGREGPLSVSFLSYETELAQAFIESGQALGYSYNPDFNGEHQSGFGRFPVTQSHNKRASTANAFLHPAMARSNLTVKTKATVQRLLLQDKQVTGVEYLHQGKLCKISADREVLLCAGAINSPRLLMLSGIGPSDHLSAMDIQVLHELPGVGENLQDHLNVPLIYGTHYPKTLDMGSLRKGLAGIQYLLTHRGPACSNSVEAGAFIRTDDSLKAPDIQIHFQALNLARNLPANIMNVDRSPGLGCQICVTHPKSRGRIRLHSSDPEDVPLIFPNYLSDEDDLNRLLTAIKIAQQIFSQQPIADYVSKVILPMADINTDQQLIEFIRNYAKTVYHPVGTCKMGPDPMAVVDDTLRVRGLSGIRIVDASIMPTIVGSNTNAATIMIAEKASDLVKKPL